MELRHLRYFVCVAEEMHFGRAAKRLGISQPPLSQQIRAMEEEMGVRLFDRTSRRVRLTEAGALFLPEAQATLRQADYALQTARRAGRGETGRLRIGFSTSVAFVPHVMDRLAEFRRRNPLVALQLDDIPRNEQLVRLDRGEIDIGIVRVFETLELPTGFHATCLQRDGMALAMRRDHPLALQAANPTLADLRGEALIMYGSINGAGFNEHLVAHCEAAGFHPHISVEASSLAALLGLTAAGFGVSLLTAPLSRLNLDTLVFRSMDVAFESELLLVRSCNPSPATQAFCNDLIGQTAQAVEPAT
ncbi:LysR family transcriptional regulator [Novosphingobium profundi]|uniref:LysR substrate-binding domain-containing protein n=1 Tax=Novosphingobium profundi TaxID=1774954 RepID=UPI001BDB4C40|nr:LysR substrate-binding domain-containing protein [Novosphingobium profundi]MBT0668005.1 LysR family transcriptional regulator [Novosphingobium profundi]